MYCSHCGTQLLEGAKFCIKCGAAVAVVNEGVITQDTVEGDIISAESPADMAEETADSGDKKPASILDKYRMGLSYLDGCGAFDEAKFREFNRVTGNQFSDADMDTQLGNAKSMIGGMDNLKQILRSSMVEAISVFEEVERQGVDLSKYNL